VRLGLMLGSDNERPRPLRLAGLVEDVQAAERAGFDSIWVPQVPGYLDAMTAITVLGQATSRIELGTAVIPVQTRHPIVMVQEALTNQMVCQGRFTLGLGASHHWIVTNQLGLPYERPARLVRHYVEVLNLAFKGPGTLDIENESFQVHSPLNVSDPIAMPTLVAALAPAMLRIAGTLADGTILWMADERAITEHVLPRLTRAAAEAGRPAPRVVAGVPVALCAADAVDDAREYASRVLGHAELSPNYLRLLEYGDATDVGDVMAAGTESDVGARIRRFRDAGVTDLAARVVPFGDDIDARARSKEQTLAFLSALMSEL